MALDNFESIFTQFPANDAQQWKEKILADLKGGDYEKLVSTNADQIPILPLYTKETAEKYQLKIPAKKSKGWLAAERIQVQHPEKANRDALNALQNGAMCIVFDLQDHIFEERDIITLLKDIQLSIAPVYFENYVSEDKIPLENAAPGSCPERIDVPQLESKSDELTYAIAKSFSISRQRIVVQFSIGSNFFMEIAKLRAFRWLWQQVNEINGIQKEMILFCETGFQHRSDDDVNNNILRNTTEAMSAIIGGCDALIVNPHDHDEQANFGKRIARNVQNILLYESNFGALEDSGRGAYFIDYLTYSLSNKVWTRLKEL